jgi:hypothetical protein
MASVGLGAHAVLNVTDGTVISPAGDSCTPRTLLRFDVSAIPAGSVIDLALIRASCSVVAETGVGAVHIEAYAATTAWTSEADWEGPWNTPGGDWDSELCFFWTVPSGDSRELLVDATEMVEEWVEGRMDNCGVILKASEGMDGVVTVSGVGEILGDSPVLEVWFTRPEVRH